MTRSGDPIPFTPSDVYPSNASLLGGSILDLIEEASQPRKLNTEPVVLFPDFEGTDIDFLDLSIYAQAMPLNHPKVEQAAVDREKVKVQPTPPSSNVAPHHKITFQPLETQPNLIFNGPNPLPLPEHRNSTRPVSQPERARHCYAQPIKTRNLTTLSWIAVTCALSGIAALGTLLAFRPGLLGLNPYDGILAPEKPIPESLLPYYHKAKTGNVAAMRMLGVMYANGLNVKKDVAEGIRWYREAAMAGSPAAIRELQELGAKP